MLVFEEKIHKSSQHPQLKFFSEKPQFEGPFSHLNTCVKGNASADLQTIVNIKQHFFSYVILGNIADFLLGGDMTAF